MIRHIVAVEKHRGIANHGKIPWDIPTDRQYYREMVKTHGGIVLMGSATYSLPLPGCRVYVASQQADFKAPGATVISNIQLFLDQQPDVWIAGGAAIYAETLHRADELYVTEIDATYDCDRFYPVYEDHFDLFKEGKLQYENGLTYRFNIYRPRP